MRTHTSRLPVALLLVTVFCGAVLTGCDSGAEKENVGVSAASRNTVQNPPPEALEAAKGKTP